MLALARPCHGANSTSAGYGVWFHTSWHLWQRRSLKSRPYRSLRTITLHSFQGMHCSPRPFPRRKINPKEAKLGKNQSRSKTGLLGESLVSFPSKRRDFRFHFRFCYPAGNRSGMCLICMCMYVFKTSVYEKKKNQTKTVIWGGGGIWRDILHQTLKKPKNETKTVKFWAEFYLKRLLK